MLADDRKESIGKNEGVASDGGGQDEFNLAYFEFRRM